MIQFVWFAVASGGIPAGWSDLLVTPLVMLMYAIPALLAATVIVVPIVHLTALGKGRDDALRSTTIPAILIITVVALFPVPMKLDPVPCEQATIVTPLASVPSWWTVDSGASEFWVYLLKVDYRSCLD